MHRLFVAVAAAALVAGAAHAETLKFHADLKGASEAPANLSPGTGSMDATLDTTSKVLTYNATYAGLSGPATAAHFHGPAKPGSNAPPQVPVAKLGNPISGTATLNDDQIDDLKSGMWYFNIHTQNVPGGEIRGQVMAAK